MEPSRLFRTFNSKILFLAVACIFLVSALYWLDALYIQTILLVWSVAMFLVIVWWEKDRSKREMSNTASFSNDERWIRIKKDIERIDKQLEKTNDGSKRQVLLSHRRFLSNELRQVEWSIREDNINALHNAQRGGMKKLNPDEQLDTRLRESRQGIEGEEKRIQSEEAKDRKNLEHLIEAAESVLRDEPLPSLRGALQPIMNDFRAHYNAIRKRDKYARTLSDYWVAWAIVLSVMNGVLVDASVMKYVSSDFRPRIVKFIKTIESLNLSGRSPENPSVISPNPIAVSEEPSYDQNEGSDESKDNNID